MARKTQPKKPAAAKAPRRRNVKPKRLAVSSAEYHEIRDMLSNSMLKLFAEDPEQYAAVFVHGTHQPDGPKKNMQFGIDVERWIFHGDLPDVALIPEEITDRKSKAFRDWKQNKSRIAKKTMTVQEAFKDERYRFYFEIKSNLENHQLADRIVNSDDVRTHDAIQWRDPKYGVLRKCQIDLFCENEFIADLKTASSIDQNDFERAIYDFKYHWQAATYIDAVYELYGLDLPFFWVVIKNSPGYGVEVFRASDEQIECGRAEYRAALKRWVACRDSGNWRSATYGLATEARLPFYVSARGVELIHKGRPFLVR